jgi:Ca-activated chloride channel family protein
MSVVWTVVRRVLIVLAFVAVLVRPGYGEREVSQTQVADVEVMVVVDRTRSMAALDHDGDRPRVAGAREDLAALVDELPGTRFGLITWGTNARLELPFTTDTTALLGALDTMRLEDPYDGSGTKVDTPLEVLTEALGEAEEQYPERTRMLVFVSDGENTAEGDQQSFADLADSVDGGLVLGYGTEQGGPMPLTGDGDDGDESGGYIEVDGRPALSKADPETLRAVAEQTGTEFVARTGAGGPDTMADLAEPFRGEYVESAVPDGEQAAAHDLTWVAGLVLFGLLLWELRVGWRAVWATPGTLGGGRGRRTSPGPGGAR